MPKATVVILRKSWGTWVLLPVVLVVDLSLWVLLDLARGNQLLYDQNRASVPWIIVFSLVAACVLVHDLYQRLRGDHVEVSSEGLLDLASRWRIGRIPWSAIDEFKVTRKVAAKIDIRLKPGASIGDAATRPSETITIYALAMTTDEERTIRQLQQQVGV